MICAACRSIVTVAMRSLCLDCAAKLPRPTRQAYATWQCDTRRAVELLTLRYTPLGELRGGRHTR